MRYSENSQNLTKSTNSCVANILMVKKKQFSRMNIKSIKQFVEINFGVFNRAPPKALKKLQNVL